MTRRLSRHTVVVLLVALISCVGGMSLAVVAFGQAGGDPDAAIPTGDFTGTTPAATTAQTTTLGGYGSTTPTVPTPVTTPGSTSTSPTSTSTSPTSTSTSPTTTSTQPTSGQSETGTSGTGSTSVSGSSPSRTSASAPQPSKATRRVPSRLAFTGGQPIVVGLFGVGLMLAGLGLGLQRWRAAALEPR